MYLRFVHLKIKPEAFLSFEAWYRKTVIPHLQKMEGCIVANLIQSAADKSECISLSIWQSPSHAQTYEKSDTYRQFQKEIRSYLADSSEWRIHLSEDYTLVSEPVPEEPIVKSFTVMQETGHVNDYGSLFVRFVSPKVHPGKREEFVKLYEEEILPVLHQVDGCLYAALSTSASDPDQLISLTICKNKRDADRYENSGQFEELVKKVRHTFSGIYQWKMQLERESGHPVFTTDDIVVEGYRVVTGTMFQ